MKTDTRSPAEVADHCEIMALETADGGDMGAAELLYMEQAHTIRRLLKTLARLNQRVHTNYDFNADPDRMTLEVGEALKGYELK